MITTTSAIPPITARFVPSDGRSGCRGVVAAVLDEAGGVSPGTTEPPGSRPGVFSGCGSAGSTSENEGSRWGSAVMQRVVPGERLLTPAATLAP